MREIFQKESRIIAVSLALGLGAAACPSKPEAADPKSQKIKAQPALFLEHRSATIDYSKNKRQVRITPNNLVFEEFCLGHNMYLRRLDSESLEPVSEMVIDNARECRDGRITPEDFGEKLNPENEDFFSLH